MRSKHELRGNNPRGHGSVSADDGPQILLCEFSQEVKSLWIDPLDIAWRIDVFGQRCE
jgi:hypothetical protein